MWGLAYYRKRRTASTIPYKTSTVLWYKPKSDGSVMQQKLPLTVPFPEYDLVDFPCGQFDITNKSNVDTGINSNFLTCSFWIRMNQTPIDGSVIFGVGAVYNYGRSIHIHTDKYIGIVNATNNTDVFSGTKCLLSLNTWYYIEAIVTGWVIGSNNTLKVYDENMILLSNRSITSSTNGYDTYNFPVKIGKVTASIDGRYFSGNIAKLRATFENGTSVAYDFAEQSGTIVYDSSGYNQHGICKTLDTQMTETQVLTFRMGVQSIYNPYSQGLSKRYPDVYKVAPIAGIGTDTGQMLIGGEYFKLLSNDAFLREHMTITTANYITEQENWITIVSGSVAKPFLFKTYTNTSPTIKALRIKALVRNNLTSASSSTINIIVKARNSSGSAVSLSAYSGHGTSWDTSASGLVLATGISVTGETTSWISLNTILYPTSGNYSEIVYLSIGVGINATSVINLSVDKSSFMIDTPYLVPLATDITKDLMGNILTHPLSPGKIPISPARIQWATTESRNNYPNPVYLGEELVRDMYNRNFNGSGVLKWNSATNLYAAQSNYGVINGSLFFRRTNAAPTQAGFYADSTILLYSINNTNLGLYYIEFDLYSDMRGAPFTSYIFTTTFGYYYFPINPQISNKKSKYSGIIYPNNASTTLLGIDIGANRDAGFFIDNVSVKKIIYTGSAPASDAAVEAIWNTYLKTTDTTSSSIMNTTIWNKDNPKYWNPAIKDSIYYDSSYPARWSLEEYRIGNVDKYWVGVDEDNNSLQTPLFVGMDDYPCYLTE